MSSETHFSLLCLFGAAPPKNDITFQVGVQPKVSISDIPLDAHNYTDAAVAVLRAALASDVQAAQDTAISSANEYTTTSIATLAASIAVSRHTNMLYAGDGHASVSAVVYVVCITCHH